MRVLLINSKPNKIYEANFFPIGLAYISKVLERAGFEVSLFDAHFIKGAKESVLNLLHERIKSFKPDIAGIGCLFSSYYQNAIEISRNIKSINKNIKVVLGGLHPTIFYNKILTEHSSFDYVILGEGEKSFLDLCNRIESSAEIGSINGIAYRVDSVIKNSPKTEYITDLDELPFPAYERFDMENYFYHYWYNKKRRGMSIITSRSCPNKCTFCSMFISHGSKWRARSPENVLDEMEFLYKKYHIRHFMFMDDNMTFGKSRAIQIFEGILDRGMSITYNFPNGVAVKSLDRDVVSIMKRSGCLELALAVESGSEFMRNKIIKKKLSNDKIFDVIELCNEYKINTKAFLVFGMPEESAETMNENVYFVKQLKGKRAVDFLVPHYATPFPGTALYEQCVKDNLIDEKVMAQLIDGRAHAYDKPIIKLTKLSSDDLVRYRNRLLRVFVLQNLFRLVSKFAVPSATNLRFLAVALSRLKFKKYQSEVNNEE